MVIRAFGRDQLIACADPWVMAYDPAQGREIWRARCLGGEAVPSPGFAGGIVLVGSVDGQLAAIRADGQGDVTSTHVLWAQEEHLPAICSPVSNGKLVFNVDSAGILVCYDLHSGRKLWEKDLDANFQASPILVGGYLYLLSDRGTWWIFEAAAQCKVVGKAEFNEECQASPAFQSSHLYLRTKSRLYCLAPTSPSPAQP